MARKSDSIILNTFFVTADVRGNNYTENITTTVATYFSFQNNCALVSEMEFIPWDNPDNLVSEQAETIARRIKDNLLWFLFLIGGPANVINIAVFYKHGLRDRVNLCLFALSLSDELSLLSAMFLYAEQLHVQFTTWVRFGPVVKFLSDNNLYLLLGHCYVSYILSAIIATERCLCVHNPLKFHRLLSTKTMVMLIVSTYILVMGLFSFVAFKYRVECVYDSTSDTILVTSIYGPVYKAYKEIIDPVESFVYGMTIPGAVMIIVMTTTLMTIVKLHQVVKWRLESSSSTLSANDLAVSKVLVVNSMFFMACLFPIAVTRMSWFFFPEIRSRRRNHNTFLTSVWITETLTTINATFNIVIYYTMGSRYRETFWALLGRTVVVRKKI